MSRSAGTGLSGVAVRGVWRVGRRAWLFFVPLVVCCGCHEVESPSGASDTRVPGIGTVLIISIDAVRPDHVSAYGYPRETTPAIDSIARDGILFTRAYAQSNWTKPSIASLFTGLYQRHHGLTVGSTRITADGAVTKGIESEPLPPELPTLAESFSRAGYRTAGFVENSHITPNQGFDRGFDDYAHASPANVWVQRWLDELDRDQPAFAFIHLIGPHDPYDRDERRYRRYRKRFEKVPSSVDFTELDYKKRTDLGDTDIRQAVSLYDSELAYYDGESVQPLIDWLRRSGRYDEALIIVTSDHGEELYDNGGWAHGHSLYEEVIRIPLIVKLPVTLQPAMLPAGSRLEDLVELVDLFPTLAELCDLELPATMDGGSLVGLLTRGHDPDHRQVAVTEYGRSYDAGIVAVAVNTPEIKMIEHYAPEHGPELHGFGRSPERRFYRVTGMDERRLDGVDDEPAAVDIRRQLEELLGRSNALQPRADHTVELTADEVERLEALGYLE